MTSLPGRISLLPSCHENVLAVVLLGTHSNRFQHSEIGLASPCTELSAELLEIASSLGVRLRMNAGGTWARIKLGMWIRVKRGGLADIEKKIQR